MVDVLHVDDDEDTSSLVCELLELEGHTVRVAHDGADGLRLLKERLPAIVILDVEMPVIDGPGMCYRMFVEDCGMENVPVILVSGATMLRAIAASVGTPYFLAKPYGPDDLVGLLCKALAEARPPRPPA